MRDPLSTPVFEQAEGLPPSGSLAVGRQMRGLGSGEVAGGL